MRKFLFSLAMLPMLLLASCSKSQPEDQPDDRLVGTKWKTVDIVGQAFLGGNCFDVYEFISTSEVENYQTRDGNVASMSVSSYKI